MSGSSEIDTPGDENGATEKLKGKKNKKGKQTKSKNQQCDEIVEESDEYESVGYNSRRAAAAGQVQHDSNEANRNYEEIKVERIPEEEKKLEGPYPYGYTLQRQRN